MWPCCQGRGNNDTTCKNTRGQVWSVDVWTPDPRRQRTFFFEYVAVSLYNNHGLVQRPLNNRAIYVGIMYVSPFNLISILFIWNRIPPFRILPRFFILNTCCIKRGIGNGRLTAVRAEVGSKLKNCSTSWPSLFTRKQCAFVYSNRI